MSKVFNLNPRKPNTLSEEAARKLEDAIAAKGEGAAGLAAEAPAPVHEVPPPVVVAAPVVEVAAPVAVIEEDSAESIAEAAPVRNTVSSRARSVTKPRARELPTTGVGTMHNPRVRKTDGVKTRSTTVHLPVELAKNLAVHCAMTGRKQSDASPKRLKRCWHRSLDRMLLLKYG